MKNNLLKKPAALLLVAALMLSMTACGGGSKDSSGGKTTTADTKNMVFQSSEMTLEGIQGDVGQYVVKGDKLYFTTYEWIEKGSGEEDASEEGGDDESGDTQDGAESEDITQQGSAEDTSEDNGEEGTEESTSEESEEGTEEGTSEESEEGTEEGTSEESEEGTEEGTSEEGTGEDASDEQEATDNEMVEEIEGESITRMYSADMDGSNVQEITLPELDGDSYISNMMVDDSGNLVLLMGSFDSKTESMTYMALKVDGTGKELAREDITKALKLGQEDYINTVKMDNQGRLIVCLERSVKVLDENFQFVDEIKMNDNAWIDGVAVSKDGTILCGVVGEKAQVMELDIEGKKWGSPLELDISYFYSSDSMMDGFGAYDFYYKDNNGIYGYILADKKSEKIMDYVASNISSDRSYGIVPIAEDTMLGMEWNDEGSVFMKYTKVDPSEIVDKTPIVLTATYIDDRIKSAAIAFNKKSDKYQIEIKDYSNEEDGATKMSADIVAGNVGDIICLDELPVEQYASKGLLEDLTPYFDKDEEINTSDIVPAIYNAMQIDGKLYYLSPSFNMVTLVAKADDVGKEPGWTFDDLKAVLDEKGEGAQPFYSNNKSDMLYSLLSAGVTDFIDWQTGKCSFDGQDFKDILEICNSYGTDAEYEYNEDDDSYPKKVKDGRILFQEGWVSMDEIQLYKAMYDADITFIGYPNAEKNGSYFRLGNTVGIYAKSDVKEGAWEFLRTLMTKEYQGTSGNLYNEPPVRQDCLDMYIKAKSATKKYTDELGNEVEPYHSSWGYEDLEVEINPASEEEVDMYLSLINNTTKVQQSNYSLLEIIQEEAKPYFAGEKSLDETVKIIQNRMETYVNENR